MPCKLVPIAGTLDFQGPTGQQVTLETKDHIGLVLLSSVEYDGRQLVPFGQAVRSVDLTVAHERRTLKLVAVFAASISGRGELREVDGEDSQFLLDLPGNEPFQMLRIIGV